MSKIKRAMCTGCNRFDADCICLPEQNLSFKDWLFLPEKQAEQSEPYAGLKEGDKVVVLSSGGDREYPGEVADRGMFDASTVYVRHDDGVLLQWPVSMVRRAA